MGNKSPSYVSKAKKEYRKNDGNPKIVNLIKDDKELKSNPPTGEQFSKCTKCGKTFEQDIREDINCYTSFKMCKDCRRELANKKYNKVKEKEVSTVTLPFSPHPWQQKAFEDFKTHRFNLWACGNRAGKDFCANMLGIWYFVQCLNENRAIYHPEMAPAVLWWIIAPTEPMAKQNWRDLKKQFPKEWIVACSDASMTMETVGGGIVEVRSAYNPESLVGVGLDLVTITEAARIGDLQTVWANLEARLGSPGRGLEKDRKGKSYGAGKAIINSTPIGKNYFYTMWKWGQKNSSEYSSAWISYQLPWTANPSNEELARTIIKTKYGEMEYEEDLRRRLGDRLFRQNYLADFLAMDGTVFKDFEEKCVINLFNMGLSKTEMEKYAKDWCTPIPYHNYRIGYDPATGSSSDTPAVVVRDMNMNRIVIAVNLYGKNYDQQWDEISFLSKRYNYAPCAWLRTGHTAVENQLAKRGVVEIPLDEQGGNKAKFIQSLERAIQNKDLSVLLDGSDTIQTLVMEMGDYTEKDGKYSNEQQEHDDFVSACYAAYYDYSEAEDKIYYCPLMGAVNRYS